MHMLLEVVNIVPKWRYTLFIASLINTDHDTALHKIVIFQYSLHISLFLVLIPDHTGGIFEPDDVAY